MKVCFFFPARALTGEGTSHIQYNSSEYTIQIELVIGV